MRSKTYDIWRAMRQRCNNPTHPSFARYGGRGITICARWDDYAAFLADMGECPPGLTLDRFPNNNGNYQPSNCKWATRKEQADNRRPTRLIAFNGKTKCIRDWERELGLGYGTVWRRLARNLPIEVALTKGKIT